VAQHALTTATTLIAYENMLSISKYLRDARTGVSFEQLLEQMSPNLRIIYDTTSPPSHEIYEAALRQREEVRAQLHDCITVNAIDALAFPPILAPPPLLGDNLEFTIGGETVSIRKVMGRNTSLGSVAGLASLVMPAGLTRKGLPVGLEFAASSGRDRALLSLGLALEPVLGPIPAPLPPELENREAAKDRIKDVMDH
jgi:Asp-tRNA(Asn)/Glu-tRNA(Gln) amidotransferase A subunit family amidase